MYQFVTNQGVEIIREIKKAVANLSAMKTSADQGWSSPSHRIGRKSDRCCLTRGFAMRSKSAAPVRHEERVNYTSVLPGGSASESASPSIKPDEGYINDQLLQ